MTACTACWWYMHAHKPGCPGEAEVPDGRVTRTGCSQPLSPQPDQYQEQA